jgi:hypothetical protein
VELPVERTAALIQCTNEATLSGCGPITSHPEGWTGETGCPVIWLTETSA